MTGLVTRGKGWTKTAETHSKKLAAFLEQSKKHFEQQRLKQMEMKDDKFN